MKRVGVSQLKTQLSSILRSVEAGAEVEVTNRGRPIARIVPVPAVRNVALLLPTRPFASVRGRRYPPAGWAVNSTELLRDERGQR